MLVDINARAHLKTGADRRSGEDRREVSASGSFPGKRTGQDRRTGPDRRSRRAGVATTYDLEMNMDESLGFLRNLKGVLEAVCVCLLLWGGFIISVDLVYGKIVSMFIGALK